MLLGHGVSLYFWISMCAEALVEGEGGRKEMRAKALSNTNAQLR